MSTNYITAADFKVYASIPATTTTHDTVITAVTAATFVAINQYTGRDFSTSTGSRVFEARGNSYTIQVDDISTATGVTISHDTANDGTYETTWAATDYELRPLNGRLNGSPWPYTEIRAVGNQSFPISYWVSDRAHVQISATWGWPAVPADVTQAAYIMALDLFKLKDAPFGAAGTTEWGVFRIRENSQLRMLLAPYCRHHALV